MTRLKKTDNTPQQPKGLLFHTCKLAQQTLSSVILHTHTLSLTHTHEEQIRCFNQLAAAHNEHSLSPSYQLPSATYFKEQIFLFFYNRLNIVAIKSEHSVCMGNKTWRVLSDVSASDIYAVKQGSNYVQVDQTALPMGETCGSWIHPICHHGDLQHGIRGERLS